MVSRIGVLAPLANRNFRLLAIGNLTSLTGDGFFRVALAVQVLAITDDDPGAIAIVAMTWALGQLIALPVGGWAGDRFDRRKVLMGADAWRGLTMGAIGVLSLSGNLELWHMMALGLGFGIGNGFFNPASMAFVPELVKDEDLTQANSLLGVARPAMVYIVGPLMGAALVGLGGAGLAFLLRAVTFSVSIVMLSMIRVPRRERTEATAAPWHEVGEAFAFVVRTRWAWPWLLGAGFGTLVFFGPFEVLFPSLLRLEFGMTDAEIASTVGYVLSAGGMGAILVGTALGQWDLPKRFLTTLYVAEAAGTSALVLLGMMRAPWQAVVAGGLSFTLFALTDIIWTTTMQRYVPRRMLGRVASLDWLTSVSLAPLGLGVAWILESTLGLRSGLMIAGTAGGTVLLLMMLVPGARDPERGVVEPAEASSGQA